MKYIVVVLFCMLAMSPGQAATAVDTGSHAVEIGNVTDHLLLGSHLKFVADPNGELTASDIASEGGEPDWQHSTEQTPNLGLNQPPHWFTLKLSNSSPREWSGLLAMTYSMIDVLDVYFAHQQKVEQVAAVGDQRPFDNRPLAHRHFLVPITVPAGETIQVILSGQTTGSLSMPLELWSLPAFFAHDQRALAAQIMFIGIMLALVIYNSFLLLATRDSNYFWYVLSMVSISFVVTSFHGTLAQYLWPDTPALNNPVLVGAISVNVFAAIMFAYRFLDLRRFPPWFRTLFLGHAAAGVLLFVLNLSLPYTLTIKLAALISVTGASMGICTGIYLWYRGEILARFYTCAWFLLLAGSVAITFSYTGLLPRIFIFTHGQQIGAVAEGLLLSFALAYRINMERQKHYLVQSELLSMQTEANLLLEQKVQERTAELQQANQRLQEVSATDGLTQVRNRYFFDETLLQEWHKDSRENQQLSLLMIDGDYFKNINDNHGHLCGDAMLKHIADIFSQSLNRAGDFVARYGGEEFSILLCHTDLDGAAIVAERIRQKVQSTPLIWDGNAISITVSIGVASDAPHREGDPESLLRAADEALYQAKAAGRNQVMLYTRTATARGETTAIIPYERGFNS